MQGKYFFPVLMIVMLCSGCYGPSYMTNYRSPDNWNGYGFNKVRCDAYNGVSFETTVDTSKVNNKTP